MNSYQTFPNSSFRADFTGHVKSDMPLSEFQKKFEVKDAKWIRDETMVRPVTRTTSLDDDEIENNSDSELEMESDSDLEDMGAEPISVRTVCLLEAMMQSHWYGKKDEGKILFQFMAKLIQSGKKCLKNLLEEMEGIVDKMNASGDEGPYTLIKKKIVGMFSMYKYNHEKPFKGQDKRVLVSKD